MTPDISRRTFVLAVLAAPLPVRAALGPPVVTILGDSITAGFGLAAKDALPAQLQQALATRGVAAQVRGAGVSGDTTAGALARVDFSVQSDTTVCVIELGGNDFLQSVDVRETERNLRAIVAKLQHRGVAVVLAGGRLADHSTGAYGRAFATMFARIARSPGVSLVPDVLAGVQGNPAMTQRDGLHPNTTGVRLIAGRLAPAVAKAIRPADVHRLPRR